MAMLLSDMMYEIHLGIRAHYASGHFDLDTALDRIQFGGMHSMPRTRAAEILRQPISVNDVRRVAGKSGRQATEESIAARLAEVPA